MAFRVNLSLIETTRISIRDIEKWIAKREKKDLPTRSLERALFVHKEWLRMLDLTP